MGSTIPYIGGPALCKSSEIKMGTSKQVSEHVCIDFSMFLTVGNVTSGLKSLTLLICNEGL